MALSSNVESPSTGPSTSTSDSQGGSSSLPASDSSSRKRKRAQDILDLRTNLFKLSAAFVETKLDKYLMALCQSLVYLDIQYKRCGTRFGVVWVMKRCARILQLDDQIFAVETGLPELFGTDCKVIDLVTVFRNEALGDSIEKTGSQPSSSGKAEPNLEFGHRLAEFIVTAASVASDIDIHSKCTISDIERKTRGTLDHILSSFKQVNDSNELLSQELLCVYARPNDLRPKFEQKYPEFPLPRSRSISPTKAATSIETSPSPSSDSHIPERRLQDFIGRNAVSEPSAPRIRPSNYGATLIPPYRARSPMKSPRRKQQKRAQDKEAIPGSQEEWDSDPSDHESGDGGGGGSGLEDGSRFGEGDKDDAGDNQTARGDGDDAGASDRGPGGELDRPHDNSSDIDRRDDKDDEHYDDHDDEQDDNSDNDDDNDKQTDTNNDERDDNRTPDLDDTCDIDEDSTRDNTDDDNDDDDIEADGIEEGFASRLDQAQSPFFRALCESGKRIVWLSPNQMDSAVRSVRQEVSRSTAMTKHDADPTIACDASDTEHDIKDILLEAMAMPPQAEIDTGKLFAQQHQDEEDLFDQTRCV